MNSAPSLDDASPLAGAPSLDDVLPLDDVLADAAPLLGDHDPLQAELWCSDFLGAFWLQGADDETTAAIVAGDLVPRLEKHATAEAALLCHALAALGHAAAGEAASRLTDAGVPAPAWAGAAAVTPVECHRHGDDFGDQESFICVYERAGARHGLVVLIDHGAGGIARDAFVVDDVPAALRDLEEESARERFVRLAPVDAAVARARLEQAFARTDEEAEEADDADEGLDVSEDLPAARAFALARARALPATPATAISTGTSTGTGADGEPDPGALTAAFLASDEAAALPDPAWAGRLVHVWAEHVLAAGDDPRRMSPGRIEDLLLDITPGAVLLDAAGQAAVPAVARAWVAWAVRGRGLSPEAAAYLGEALDEVLEEFPAGYLDLQAVLYRHANEDTVDLRG